MFLVVFSCNSRFIRLIDIALIVTSDFLVQKHTEPTKCIIAAHAIVMGKYQIPFNHS